MASVAPGRMGRRIDGNEKLKMEASSGPGSHRACVTFPHDKGGRLESIRVKKQALERVRERRRPRGWGEEQERKEGRKGMS